MVITAARRSGVCGVSPFHTCAFLAIDAAILRACAVYVGGIRVRVRGDFRERQFVSCFASQSADRISIGSWYQFPMLIRWALLRERKRMHSPRMKGQNTRILFCSATVEREPVHPMLKFLRLKQITSCRRQILQAVALLTIICSPAYTFTM